MYVKHALCLHDLVCAVTVALELGYMTANF